MTRHAAIVGAALGSLILGAISTIVLGSLIVVLATFTLPSASGSPMDWGIGVLLVTIFLFTLTVVFRGLYEPFTR